MRLLPILFLPALLAPHPLRAQSCESLDAVRWILGTWVTEDGRTVSRETWRQVSPRTLEGTGEVSGMEDARMRTVETLRIVEMSGQVFLLAKVDQNPLPTAFAAVLCDEGEVVFENPEHDFPKRLHYRRVGRDSLIARVSDGGDRGFTLRYAAGRATGVRAGEIVSGDPTIVVPGTAVERLFDGGFFTEGPAVAPDGSVYFSDITFTNASGMQAGHIWRHDPTTGLTTIYRSPSGMSNGIVFDAEDRMVVAEGADYGGRRITRTDLATGRSVIVAGLFEDRPFNSPNDLVIGGTGRIYFTDPRYTGHEPVEQPVEGVYRIDPDGSVTLLAGDIEKPNGILLSPDGRRLYVAAVGGSRNAIFAIDLDDAGEVVGRSILVDFGPGNGPDGMAMDVDGNLYAARNADPRGIHVYSPAGQPLAVIPVPEGTTNVTFGRGPTARTLYITAGRSLYSIEVAKEGLRLLDR